MSALHRQPDPDPQERADIFVATHQAAYSEALTSAREASATTSTPAWRNGYRTNMESHREIVNSHIKSIAAHCDTIKTMDTSEDFEKEIRDSVKALAEERVRHNAWRQRTIKPYQDAAERCAGIATKAVRAAEQAEREQPLIHRGLTAEVRKRVDSWPKVSWDEEAGSVELLPPGGSDSD